MRLFQHWQAIALLIYSTPSFAQLLKTKTPEGCRKLNTDTDWPAQKAWEDAMPGVEYLRSAFKRGTTPDYRYQVRSVPDVQRALKFAQDNNIRVTIITTGHDYLGRSTASSGLLLDMSLLRGIKIHESFTPTAEGVENVTWDQKPNVITPKPGVQAAVTIGPGVLGQPLNTALHPSGLFAVAGSESTVAPAGGWGQLGGHSPVSQQYGLGVDQFLEVKLVTPEGKYIVANKIINPDIFWAVRGGGGGTFGVLVEATMKVYPDTNFTVLTFWMNSTSWLPSAMNKPVEYFLNKVPDLYDQGVSGYFVPALGSFRGQAIHPGKWSGVENAKRIWKPILDEMSKFPTMVQYQAKTYDFKSWKEFYDTAYGTIEEHGLAKTGSPVLKPQAKGMVPFQSRLLTAQHVRSPKIMDAISGSLNNVALMLVTPGQRHGDGSDTSATPAWRNATIHVQGFRMPGVMNLDKLRDFAPEMGSYGNEGFYDEPNWQHSFWGANYPKLAQIKRRVDPKQLLWVSPGIDAERQEVRKGRLCKVANPAVVKKTTIAPYTDNRDGAPWILERQRVLGGMPLIETYPAPGTFVGL